MGVKIQIYGVSEGQTASIFTTDTLVQYWGQSLTSRLHVED